MGTICGLYYRNNQQITTELSAMIMRQSNHYYFDETGTWQEKSVFLGSHAQHITPESLFESNPCHDPQTGLTITADAIIDNRHELCEIFKIEYSRQAETPDNLLILYAYRQWGKDCVKHLLGDFAFAIWDERRRELFCAVDHTGTRAFYYYHAPGLFAFSTLIKPLLRLPEISQEYNESWIADFLAMPSVMHQLDAELTLYKHIYLLPAGHWLIIQPDRSEKRLYWQAEQQPILRLKSDAAYEEAFREVFSTAVHCRMRCRRQVGVMMSGGLDSTSVACMAARKLAKQAEKLLAFSAVPVAGYRDWLPEYSLADETPFIEAVRQATGNIEVIYCQLAGKHSLSDTDRLLAMLEQPYKIVENLFWLDGIMAAAQERNIGVILTGNSGNMTISWGDIAPYLRLLLHNRQWHRLLGEAWARARRCRQPLKALLLLLETVMPYRLQQAVNTVRHPQWRKAIQDLVPINPDFAQSSLVKERFQKFGYDALLMKPLDSLGARQQYLRPDVFSHLGVIATKHALLYRLVLRDPTLDKRVIEFCLSVPESQYVRNGRDRFLLRRAMAGILPDKVRLNETVRGRQSADLAQRLQPVWTELAAEIKSIGTRDEEKKYLNIAKIQQVLLEFSSLRDEDTDDENLRMLIRSLIFSRFFQQEKRGQRVSKA